MNVQSINRLSAHRPRGTAFRTCVSSVSSVSDDVPQRGLFCHLAHQPAISSSGLGTSASCTSSMDSHLVSLLHPGKRDNVEAREATIFRSVSNSLYARRTGFRPFLRTIARRNCFDQINSPASEKNIKQDTVVHRRQKRDC